MGKKKLIVFWAMMVLILGTTGLSFSLGHGEARVEKDGEKIESAYFAVEIHEPEEWDRFEEGEEVTVEYSVKNTGEESGTQGIVFSVDGTEEYFGVYLTLGAGEDYEGEFTWGAEEAGEYDLEVASEDTSDSVVIVVGEVAFFKTEITSYEEEVVEGEEVTVEYEVENIGGGEERQEIEFVVYDHDGRVVYSDSEEFRISAGNSITEEFVWKTEEGDPGEYVLEVSSDNDADEVDVTVLEDSTFEVEIYDHDEEVMKDDEVVVQYRIHNTGEVEGAQDILLLANGDEVETKTGLALGPDETTADVFRWDTEGYESGDYDLTVESEDDENTVAVTILEPARFEVEIVDYDEEVEKGETVSLIYNITNVGDVEGTQEIKFKVDGIVEDSREVTIMENESHEGEFTWDTDGEDDGDYELTVQSEEYQEEVTVTIEEEEETPGFTLGLVTIAIVFAVMIYKKKKQ